MTCFIQDVRNLDILFECVLTLEKIQSLQVLSVFLSIQSNNVDIDHLYVSHYDSANTHFFKSSISNQEILLQPPPVYQSAKLSKSICMVVLVEI
jgi:hypothetical protein